jgi:hypothetical protein
VIGEDENQPQGHKDSREIQKMVAVVLFNRPTFQFFLVDCVDAFFFEPLWLILLSVSSSA